MNKLTSMALGLSCILTPQPGAAQEPVDVTGIWVHRVVTTSVSKLPVLGKVVNQSRFFARVQLRQRGDQVDVRIEPCWVRIIGEMKRIQTIVPDPVVAVMGPKARRATFDGTTLSIHRAVDVLGARLADEWRDALPDSPDAATQWDEDGDGKPGVTIRIMGPIDGEVYVVQRSWNALRGQVDPTGDRIRGLVTWSTEQQVLGASSVFLRANPASQPHPDESKSHFEMRRITPTTTCADIKRRNDALFGGDE